MLRNTTKLSISRFAGTTPAPQQGLDVAQADSVLFAAAIVLLSGILLLSTI